MAISDEDVVRQLESVPLVDAPDMRDSVMSGIHRAGSAGGWAPAASRRLNRRLYLGLAWAAAVTIVVGIALQRASSPRPQTSGATMASVPAEEWPVVARVSSRSEGATLTVRRSGDLFAAQASVQGRIDWDREKLSMIEVLPSHIVILQRRTDASGSAEIRLSVGDREILKTAISVD